MDELFRLFPHGLRYLGPVVPHAGGQDTAEEIQVFLTFHIPDIHALAPLQWQGFGIVEQMVGKQIFLLLLEDLRFFVGCYFFSFHG